MHLLRYILSFIFLILLSGCGIFSEDQVPVPAPVQAPFRPLVQEPSLETHNAKLAYVAEGNGKILLCNIESDSQLSGCTETGTANDGNVPTWIPDNVAFHTYNGVTHAYVASNTSVFVCDIATNNSLVNCRTTGNLSNNTPVSWLPTELKFNIESGVTYAYVTGVKTVYHCSIMGDGSLGDCALTGSGAANKPMSWLPNGIDFNKINGHDYAYVSVSKYLFQCQVESNADLVNCHQTGVDSATTKLHWHPSNTTFSHQGAGFYAYVADPNHLYQCNVDNNGNLLNCNAAGTDNTGHTIHWLANNVTFNFMGQQKYAYVVGVYGVYLCNVSGFNGALSNCALTGRAADGSPLKWNPNSITLRE